MVGRTRFQRAYCVNAAGDRTVSIEPNSVTAFFLVNRIVATYPSLGVLTAIALLRHIVLPSRVAPTLSMHHHLTLLAGVASILVYIVYCALRTSHVPPGPRSSSRVMKSIRRQAYEGFAQWSLEYGQSSRGYLSLTNKS